MSALEGSLPRRVRHMPNGIVSVRFIRISQSTLMRYLTAISSFLTLAAIGASAQEPAVTYVPADKVMAALKEGTRIAAGPDFIALGATRTGPGQVEVHEKETDTFLRDRRRRHVRDRRKDDRGEGLAAEPMARDEHRGRPDPSSQEGRLHQRARRGTSLVQRGADVDQLLRGQVSEAVISVSCHRLVKIG